MIDDVIDRFRLSGKVALVTGASSGLGARFAEVLANAGAQVIAAARRAELLDRLAEQHEHILAVRCDVTEPEDRASLVKTAVEVCGRLDILVNNAGTTGNAAIPAEDETPAGFRTMLNTNLESAFGLSVLAFNELRKDGRGTVINVASILGTVSSAPFNQVGYCASKAGLIGLTRDLAVQWAQKGVRVNALAPGFFMSEGTDALLNNDASRRWVERNAPMGRIGSEDELDGAVVYLASDASSYTTGHVLVVDGGWTSR